MRIIIAGSRHLEDPATVEGAISESPFAGKITHVIEGGAKGADRLAREWAVARGIQVTTVEANWKLRGAGPRRNRAMARDHGAEGCIVITTGGKGSASMIAEARKANVPLHVVEPAPVDG